jgi:hypothetical protein
MNSINTFGKLLRGFNIKSPVVFTFHLNWKVYENLQLEQFKHVGFNFKYRGMKNFEFLPILTDSKSDLENRIKQFKKGIERISDKYESKCHVVAYSFAGIIPRGYVSLFNGENCVQSILSIGTPNKGSLFVNQLISRDYSYDWYMIEPALRATGVHQDWLMEEYSSKTMHDTNSLFVSSPDVRYMSVGGRREKFKMSESLRFIHENLNDNLQEDVPNDGIIVTKESEFGEHLINFDADHFELIGMRPDFSTGLIFDLYSDSIKNSDNDFLNFVKERKKTNI